jgi:RecB family endonuclease NucS
MLGTASLQKIGEVWQFSSEAALEDFVWDNLPELLDLTPLQCQYISNGEICDILAIDKRQGLVILQLKNAEDRYVVQQLTRYYHNLVSERAFATAIDYTRPIRLVALAPSFHKYNLIDRQHLNLTIDFWQVSILHNDGEFSLQLQDIDTHQSQSLPIPYQELNSP